MAIESLTDRMFSIQSDVWSYGVLLWEIFSLSQTPYASINSITYKTHKNNNKIIDSVSDITVLKDLIQFLSDGHRMEMPILGPDLICNIMAHCWEKEPGDRPTFNELKIELKNMLKENLIFQQQYHLNGSWYFIHQRRQK